jgi:predicted AlkP superfamily pyrophosphatase or phosphodiesterase
MTLSRSLFFLTRAIFGVFLLLTASYCLLAYVPFTYHQIVVEAPLPWLAMFVRFHSYLYWLVLGMQVATILPDIRQGATLPPSDAGSSVFSRKALAIGFLVFSAGLGVVLLVHPLLAGIRNTLGSLYIGLMFLLPLAWLGALDWLGRRQTLRWQTVGTGEYFRIFTAAWESAIFLSLLYYAIFFLRWGGPLTTGFGGGEATLSLSWTVVCHLLAFMGVFLTLSLVHGAASWFDNPPKVEFAFCAAIGCLLVAGILRFLIFPLISFVGPRADMVALGTGIALAAFTAGFSAKLFPNENNPVESGLALLLTPLRWGRIFPGAWGFVPLAILGALAYFLEVRSAVLDWNFLRQKLSALLIWIATFANFYELAPRKQREGMSLFGRVALICVAVGSFGAYKSLGLWQRYYQRQTEGKKVDVAAVLEAYSGFDASFKLLHDLLAPAGGRPGFYKFLLDNTNLPWSAGTHPVEVDLVNNLTPTNSPKPNIFIIVIDSLRRDYVSSYNPAVTFTPNIEAFGRESIVMENAFAKYAGTGLSEPSIWSGGLLLHEQYVTPFYPMNALQRLLETDGYRWFIMDDFILRMILHPPNGTVQLDSDIPGRRFDFCQTLGDLENEISHEKGSAAPIFAYAQPQNIHMWTLNQEGESVPPGETYPGFYAPVASRLKQMDLCWGNFIQFMKRSGLYDNSIIILTADHGDLLGEGGAWGHGFALFKEMIEIPLIIHLPTAMRSHLYFDPKKITFLTDITPSLYYLLGHRPIVQNEIFGRPLFTETEAEEAQYLRDSYLIVSSYTPVYGILKENGHWLYFVSANDAKDYQFDLPENSPAIEKPVTESIRKENELLIRKDILAIDHFYQYEPPQ